MNGIPFRVYSHSVFLGQAQDPPHLQKVSERTNCSATSTEQLESDSCLQSGSAGTRYYLWYWLWAAVGKHQDFLSDKSLNLLSLYRKYLSSRFPHLKLAAVLVFMNGKRDGLNTTHSFGMPEHTPAYSNTALKEENASYILCKFSRENKNIIWNIKKPALILTGAKVE